jgi:methyl halide transferase
MPPNLRPAWSKRMCELLAPGGTLICLEFPTYKEPATGGPPWGLTPETYEMLLPFPGEEPQYDDKEYVVKQEGRTANPKGLVRVAHWKAERTHPVGQGTDNVGVWKHKGEVADV